MEVNNQIMTSPAPDKGGSSSGSLGSHLARRLAQIGESDVSSVPGDFNLTLLDHLIAEPGLSLVGCCTCELAGDLYSWRGPNSNDYGAGSWSASYYWPAGFYAGVTVLSDRHLCSGYKRLGPRKCDDDATWSS